MYRRTGAPLDLFFPRARLLAVRLRVSFFPPESFLPHESLSRFRFASTARERSERFRCATLYIVQDAAQVDAGLPRDRESKEYTLQSLGVYCQQWDFTIAIRVIWLLRASISQPFPSDRQRRPLINAHARYLIYMHQFLKFLSYSSVTD